MIWVSWTKNGTAEDGGAVTEPAKLPLVDERAIGAYLLLVRPCRSADNDAAQPT